MAEIIIVPKAIVSGIVWRVNINQLDFPSKFLSEAVQGKEVIGFDDKVILDCAALVSLKLSYWLFSIFGNSFGNLYQ